MRTFQRLTVVSIMLALVLAAAPVFAAEARGVVNVNSASAEQLQLLPRVGPSVAAKIISFRTDNGPFKSTDDLMLVPGIGDKSFALMKPHLALAGETTLSEKVRTPREAKTDESKQ